MAEEMMDRWEDAEYVSKLIQDAMNRRRVFKDPLDPTNTKAYKCPGGGRCYAGRQARKYAPR
jgi:hypothetical protein